MGSQRVGHDLATEQQQQHLWWPLHFTKGATREQTWGSKGESQWGPVVVVDISVALSSLTLHPQIRSDFKGKAFLRTWDPSLCQAVTLGHAFVNRKWSWGNLHHWCSKCSPHGSRISITWELVNKACSQASLQTPWISNCGGRGWNPEIWVITYLKHTDVKEPLI